MTKTLEDLAKGHTPTPFFLDGTCVYSLDETGSSNRFCAQLSGGYVVEGRERTDADELRATAAFILQACNSHDALTAVAADLVAWEERYPADEIYSHGKICVIAQELTDIVNRAKAALSLAAGKEEV